MKSAAIIINPEKPDAIRLAGELVSWLQDHGVLVMAEHESAIAMGAPSLSRDESLLAKADFAIVMGGDGTLLRASRITTPAGVPMLPLRFGQFGFMTDIQPQDAVQALEKVLDGRYNIDERLTLQAAIYCGQDCVQTSSALNDMVIAKGPLSRMLHLAVGVSGRYISTYAADGLIVATPTGSTAYSLSAGGPLVTPELNVILVTPICPHTLNVRSLIVSNRETVEVTVASDVREVVLTIDGQHGIPLSPGDKVCIRDSGHRAKLINVDGTSFYEKLQTRLRWGDRFDCRP